MEGHSIMTNMTNTPRNNEKFLFLFYSGIIHFGERDFFERIGLSRTPTFDEYVAHYEGDEGTIVNRAERDIFNYPPLVEKVSARENTRESEYTDSKHLDALTEMVKECQERVDKYGRPEDKQALEKGRVMLNEMLEAGKFQRH